MNTRHFTNGSAVLAVSWDKVSTSNPHVLQDPQDPAGSAPIDGWRETTPQAASTARHRNEVVAKRAAEEDALKAKRAWDELTEGGMSGDTATILTSHVPQ